MQNAAKRCVSTFQGKSPAWIDCIDVVSAVHQPGERVAQLGVS